MPQVDRETLLATLNSLKGNDTLTKGSTFVLLMLKLLDPVLYAQVDAFWRPEVVQKQLNGTFVYR